MISLKRIFFVILWCLFSAVSSAETGLSFSNILISKDPENLHTYRFSTWDQPESLKWKHVHIYFDASIAHWWISENMPNHELNIIAVTPILRYYFATNPYFSPFFNVGIGPSYLSKTVIDNQQLGMHFAFQDQVGLGATVGKTQALSILFSAFHYSNGSLGAHNSGITVPMMLTAEYRIA